MAPSGQRNWDEAAAVARAKQQPEAFARLYDEYHALIYSYCFRRLRNREMAEDVTSQTFLSAFRSLNSFQGPSFRSWLFAIAHNTVVDAYRRQGRELVLIATTDPEDSGLTPEEITLAREQSSHLHRLIARLSPAQRDVIELRLAGLTGKEIAQVLNRTESAVKSLQFRGIAQLRECYGEQLRGERSERA